MRQTQAKFRQALRREWSCRQQKARELLTQGRAWLIGLLGEERLRVLADEEQGFRVEGTLYVPLTRETPGERELHRASLAYVVAGARYARVCTLPVPLRLPVNGMVGASAAAV